MMKAADALDAFDRIQLDDYAHGEPGQAEAREADVESVRAALVHPALTAEEARRVSLWVDRPHSELGVTDYVLRDKLRDIAEGAGS